MKNPLERTFQQEIKEIKREKKKTMKDIQTGEIKIYAATEVIGIIEVIIM